jgi:hydroxypyruvate reductase
MTPSPWTNASAAHALVECYREAIRAVDPGHALHQVLQSSRPPARAVHLLATGKAAVAMYRSGVSWLATEGRQPAQGLVVTTEGLAATCPDLPVVAGDHPIPGQRSLEAAEAVGDFVARVAPGDEMWLLLSGGTTSLIAAPVHGISAPDLARLFVQLGEAGLDIHRANAIRKRFLRWGAGRLALAIAPARCLTFALSDVPGDDAASIGSGPTVADATIISDIVTLLAHPGASIEPPATILANIAATGRGDLPETPKPELSIFSDGIFQLIATNRMAQEAAAHHGRRQGWTVHRHDEPIRGEASAVGAALGRTLAGAISRPVAGTHLHVWGGETTVTLSHDGLGAGGRCQELALASAGELRTLPAVAALLAGGTDGRDGPTDAAGAVVTPETWHRIRRAGLDPTQALAQHASYHALDAADSLLKVGETGTNVADLVLGLVAG